jgi:hypothetical protein
MKRALVLFAALAFHTGAHAQAVQVATIVPPTLEVQRLAPQLVAFVGGEVNFANLVNGLALGLPVTLSTPLADGTTQIATFTPTGTLTSLQVAQLLESARQSLIARGIATPTAQQLGTTLLGGGLQTALGVTQLTPLINATSALGTTSVGTTTLGQQLSPAAAIQAAQSAAIAGGTAGTVRNTSDSLFPRGISDTPPTLVPGFTALTPGAATTTTTTTAPAGATREAPIQAIAPR